MVNVTIHCVRHAQGFHNVSPENYQIRDPLLTPRGKDQCETLSRAFSSPQKITHLVSSPLRRTLYTTLLSFPTALARGLKVIALAELQENSRLPCDTGSSLEDLQAEFAEGELARRVDLGDIGPYWNSKQGCWCTTLGDVKRRARAARRFLFALAQRSIADNPEKDVEIVVVTHGGFLRYLTDDFESVWANTEVRSYRFVDGIAHGAKLKETMESRFARTGHKSELGREGGAEDDKRCD